LGVLWLRCGSHGGSSASRGRFHCTGRPILLELEGPAIDHDLVELLREVGVVKVNSRFEGLGLRRAPQIRKRPRPVDFVSRLGEETAFPSQKDTTMPRPRSKRPVHLEVTGLA